MKNLHFLFILLLCCFISTISYASKPNPNPKDSTSIAELLNPDGSLNLSTGFTGSLNLDGFEVYIDECNGIIAQPKATKANTATEEGCWSALGSGLNGTCYAIAISGTEVYAGGSFTSAGGVAANRIAKWDGSNWSALGEGLSSSHSSSCHAIAISGMEVYAGGYFTTAGGVAANCIAKWDGSNWSALGSGLDDRCLSIAISGTEVYAGGYFTTAGGVAANSIAKWDGSNWSALGSGLSGTCYAIAISGTEVYAGGQFTSAGGVAANSIAKWDGSNWSALGSGLSGTCYAIAISGTEVYAGGYFTSAGGVAANQIAKYSPAPTWYIDADGDDYGSSSMEQCDRPTNGFLLSELSGSGDCNDDPTTGPTINPGATEICDGIDNNCADGIDEGSVCCEVRGGSVAGAATVCSGSNSSLLTLSGHAGDVVKWQSATTMDFSSPTDITHTMTTYTAQNLTQSTYFRAIVKDGDCDEANATAVLITINSASNGGTIAGATTVCAATNSIELTLNGQVGSILKWQSATNMAFSSPTDIANTTTSHTAENLTQSTYFRAIVKNGVCDEANSAAAMITVDALSNGGTIGGAATVCAATNSTTLTLSGQVGSILKWQSATNPAFSSPTDIANTSTSYTAENLTQSTYFRAIVKNGVCAEATSATASIAYDLTDSDGDTVPDCLDKCTGGDDRNNDDGDSMPNACDCLPTQPNDVVEVSVDPAFGIYIPPGIYYANETITSDGKIYGPSIPPNKIEFIAGQSITLKPGFHAEAGSDFLAKIELCQPSMLLEVPQFASARVNKLPSNTIDLSIYPNLFKGASELSLTLDAAETISVHLYNPMGHRIQTVLDQEPLEAGRYQFRIQNNGEQNGLFYVVLTSPTRRISRKVITLR